ncbi:MAG: DUF502 domain-containing protein [Candidatus Hydrothermarchaeota archaeon]|jgi:uncharacterized membrane protein|nr:DUF502 domain-containing protein [Candidatus Hydrothermarchaeota archaeon]
MKGKIIQKLRNLFITGLVIFIPLAVTIYVLWITFNILDGFLKPLVVAVYGKAIPGISLLVTLFLILTIGAFARAAIGKSIFDYLDKGVLRIPIVRSIYSTIKGASTAFLMPKQGGFKSVVLVEYPRKKSYALAFTTGLSTGEVQKKTAEKTVNVFVPTSPNPTSGFFLMVPEKDLILLNMSVEEALKFVVSGGLSK